MKHQEYSDALRKSRGALKNMDNVIRDIYIFGNENFIQWTLNAKTVGLRKARDIASNLSHEEQDEFIVWCKESPRKKVDIDIKLLEY